MRNIGRYSKHYARMGNRPPDWLLGEAAPERFACRGPWLPREKNARILDFGCGYGHMLLSLWCAGYHQLEGVELDQGQYEAAVRAAAGRCRIHLADGVEFLAERTDTYELIVLCDVIEHLEPGQVPEVLRRVHKALRRGGTVYVRTPNMSSLLGAYSRYLDFTHRCGFTEYSLIQVLDNAGFEDITLQPEPKGWCLSSWRPWLPWRGLGLRWLFNQLAHRLLYAARSQVPGPTTYALNLEAYARKGTSDAGSAFILA